jgi:4-hydroxy-tetrahydrodipicolinate synthase
MAGNPAVSPFAELRRTLTGILPPATTPFDRAGNLMASALAEQMNFLLERGANGVIVGGSTGEGHTLDLKEFVAAVAAAHDAVGGRKPLVAGLIVNSTLQAIERAKALAGLNVAALQITPAHYLFKPSADATLAHFRAIYQAVGIPIIIYNVIPWNYLSVPLMLRIMREEPGVIGMKQSGGDLDSVSLLVQQVEPHNLVLTGVDALLYPAFVIGVHGAICGLTAALPGVCARMWDAVQQKDLDTARHLHRCLGTLWNSMPHDVMPAAVKYIQHRQGLGMHYPRPPMDQVGEEVKASIDKALAPLLR